VEGSAVFTTVPKERPSLSETTAGPLAAILRLAVKAAFTRAPSVGSAMAERNEVFRRAEALALAVEVVFTAAVEAALTAAADTADVLTLN
jgi:hypothetical protein